MTQKTSSELRVPATQADNVEDAPAGGTGATAGAYDTAANRDKMIALVNALKAIAVANGFMAADPA